MTSERVIVVGGSSGIGEASARLLLNRGMAVVIAGRNRIKLEQARDRIGKTCCRGFVSANGAGLLTHAEVTQVG